MCLTKRIPSSFGDISTLNREEDFSKSSSFLIARKAVQMASSLDMAQTQRANPRRNKISITQKRWLLSAHLLFVTAWLGSGLCSLAFNITALFTTDPHLLNTV